MGFFDEEPTFTVEEFLHSWVPGLHWFDPTIENLGYTTVKLGMVVAPLAAKAAWIYKWGLTAEAIALHGGRWQAAGYLATQESWAFYRLMTKPHRMIRATSTLARGLPGVVVPVAGLYSVHVGYEVAQKGVQNIGESKPWWTGIIPIPVAGLLGLTD